MSSGTTVVPLAEVLADVPAAPTQEIGWFCTYTPEELILAAGLTPRRLRGGCEPIRSADGHLHNNLCPYVRSTLDVALHDEDAPVEGVVTVASCDSMRRLHDAWCAQMGPQFEFLLSMPRLNTQEAIDFATHEFGELREQLSAYAGRPITDADVLAGTATMNAVRGVLRNVADLHAEGYPEVTGDDLAACVDAAMRWPKTVFIERIGTWAAQVRATSAPKPRRGPRILLAGGILDHAYVMSLVEELGGCVVVDDLCTGRRYYETDASLNGDVVRSVAARQLERSSCARMRDTERRVQEILERCEEYNIDGVIYYTIKFCDPHLYDYVFVERGLREAGLPVLRWESDHTAGARGQMRTRIEAFLEMLQ